MQTLRFADEKEMADYIASYIDHHMAEWLGFDQDGMPLLVPLKPSYCPACLGEPHATCPEAGLSQHG
jgi:hypothetical protein